MSIIEEFETRWYDLKIQELLGSIISSVIFHQIKYLIELNISQGEKAFRYKCFSHIGKPGVCITHAEIAEYIGTDKSKISYAIDKLKSANLIGMDYVSIEAMRAPFFFLEKGCDTLPAEENYNLRYYFLDVMKKLNCFNSSAIHGHIAFRNEVTETRKGGPLIQSFQFIAQNVGLTPKQVKASMKYLIDSERVFASASKDRRYSLQAVIGDLRKKDSWSPKKGLMVSEKETDGLGKRDDYKSSQDSHVFEVEEKTPTFSTEKREEKERVVKIRGIEFSASQAAELTESFEEEDLEVILNRYPIEKAKNASFLTGDLMTDIRKIGLYRSMDKAEKKQKHKEEQSKKEQEKRNEPIEIMMPHHMSMQRQMRSHNTSERVVLLADRIKQIKERYPDRYESSFQGSLDMFHYSAFSQDEKNALMNILEIDHQDKVFSILLAQ